MMTAVQRIRALLRGDACDRLPVQPLIMMLAAQHAGVRYSDYCRDGRVLAKAQIQFARDYDIDVVTACSDPTRELIDIAGEESIEWFDDQPPAIREDRAALADKSRIESLRLPDPHAPGRMNDRLQAITIMAKVCGGQKSVCGWVEGPLALAADLRGINAVMTDLLDDPEYVMRLMDIAVDTAIAFGREQARCGADTIGMGDAAASLIGPRFYRQFVLERERRVLAALKQAGAITRLHICGQTGPIMADMATLPADIYELDFPVDLARARQILGPERVILGNVSTIGELLNGTQESVAAAAARCHRVCGRFHVVGAGCEVSPRTPRENLRALIRYGLTHTPEGTPA